MNFRELEKIIISDGWKLKNTVGSHNQYTHPEKKGKVTIPNHRGDVSKAVVNSVLNKPD